MIDEGHSASVGTVQAVGIMVYCSLHQLGEVWTLPTAYRHATGSGDDVQYVGSLSR